MKSWGRLLLIFIAYGIALLHTAVPHHHATAGNGEPVFLHAGCGQPHSTSGFLQRVLSTDLGAGHLETFKKGGDFEMVFASPHVAITGVLTNILELIFSDQAHGEYWGAFLQNLKRQLCLFSVSHLRAPPAR